MLEILNSAFEFFKRFIQYEITLFTTSLKDWNYLNIVVACVTILTGIFAFIGLLAFCFVTGFFWVLTLSVSIFLYRFANRKNAGQINNDSGLDDEDRMLLKAVSGGFFIVTLLIFLAFLF